MWHLFLLYLRVQRLFGAKFQLEFTCYKIGKSITESWTYIVNLYVRCYEQCAFFFSVPDFCHSLQNFPCHTVCKDVLTSILIVLSYGMYVVYLIDICWISLLIFHILLTMFKFMLFLNAEIVWYSVHCCVHLYCQHFDTVYSKTIQGTLFNVTLMFICLPLHTFTSQITIFWMPLQDKSKLWRVKRGTVHSNSFGSSTVSVKRLSEV